MIIISTSIEPLRLNFELYRSNGKNHCSPIMRIEMLGEKYDSSCFCRILLFTSYSTIVSSSSLACDEFKFTFFGKRIQAAFFK